MSLKHKVCIKLLNHQSHWALVKANQNTKEIIINKTQQRKCTYTEKLVSPKQLILIPHMPYIHCPEIYLNGEVYMGPSVTLLSKIIMLLSRYVNSTVLIRYHVFSWWKSLWALSQSLFYINDINQNGIHQNIPKSIRHVILRAFLQAIFRSTNEILKSRTGSPTRKHQASWFPVEEKKIWKLSRGSYSWSNVT